MKSVMRILLVACVIAIIPASASASVFVSNNTPGYVMKVIVVHNVYCGEWYNVTYTCEHNLNYGESIVFNDNAEGGCTHGYGVGSITWIPVQGDATLSIQSVTGADYIGDDADGGNYVCNSDSGEVVVTVSVSPQTGATIVWDGGTPGATNADRRVSRANVNTAGTVVRASIGPNSVKAKIRVYNAVPNASNVLVTKHEVRNNGIVSPGAEFGKALQPYNAVESFGVYLHEGYYKFTFNSIDYDVIWGMHSKDGQTDVTNPAANPFPAGLNMTGTHEQRKARAKSDLTTAASTNIPPRTSYWSSAMTQQHELFHGSDMYSFITPKMLEAEAWIESSSQWVAVTPANAGNSNAILQAKVSSFNSKVSEKMDLADNAFKAGAGPEPRAYADGVAGYTALKNAIP